MKNRMIVAVVATIISLSSCGSNPEKQSKPPATVFGVAVEIVGLQTLPETYEAVGTVRSATVSVLAAQLSGTVREVRVNPGERVRRGQILALLDDRGPRAQLAAAQAGV